MRARIAVLASVLCALAVVSVTGVAAAPSQHRGLTINATPNPVNAGEGVLVYGQLNGPSAGGQTVRLYHKVYPNQQFTLVDSAKTNPQGFYEFPRAEGLVTTNRNWYVSGPNGSRSRVLHERVRALVSLSVSNSNPDTHHPVVFSGHVYPNHVGQRVLLQRQKGSADDWRTIKSGLIGPGSTYSITYRWRVAGERTLRVVLRGDRRNIRSESDPVTVTVQQAQVPGFTITSSSPVISEGSSAKISGVLDKPGTTTPEASTSVSLWGRTPDQRFKVLATTTTGADGSYSFTVNPTRNTLYQVRTTFAPHRHTAVLYEAVRDIVTLTASSSTAKVGDKVTFQGTVTPDKAGHLVYLQMLGKDGDWHSVEATRVRYDSTFQFVWRFTEEGTHKFRARIWHDEQNRGDESSSVTVQVSGVSTAPITSAS